MIFFWLSCKSTPQPLPHTPHLPCCSICSPQFAYFSAWLVEKLHEVVDMYSESEFNYTLFFLCCLSSPTLSSFKNHYNFASCVFPFILFADQSPSYFIPNTYHLGVCKEPVFSFQPDQRRLAQLKELRAKFFLS